MKLEPKLALQATLYLALIVGFIVLIAFLPWWVDAAIGLGVLWLMLYISLQQVHRLKQPK
jgi:membrane protein implicated in regulation of membrane protease activity